MSAKKKDRILQCGEPECLALFHESSVDAIQGRAYEATRRVLCRVCSMLWWVEYRAAKERAEDTNTSRSLCEHEWEVSATSDGYKYWECLKCGQRAKARPGEIV